MLVEMRHAPDPRLLLEVALVQLTHDAAGADLHGLMSRARTPRAGRRPRQRRGRAGQGACPPTPSTGRATIGGRARRATATRHTEPAQPRRRRPPQVERHPSQAPPQPSAAPHRASAASASTTATIAVTVRDGRSVPALRGMAKAIYMGGSCRHDARRCVADQLRRRAASRHVPRSTAPRSSGRSPPPPVAHGPAGVGRSITPRATTTTSSS